MKSPSLWNTIAQELFTYSSFFVVVGIGLIYILISVVLLNYKLITTVFFGSFQFLAKVSLFFSLIFGTWTSLNHLDFWLLIINALFFGMNILLIGKTLSVLEHQGKVRLSIGGATVVSLITTGCASCGLSLFSVLGVGASLSLLPFYSLIFHLTATALLMLSTLYMLKKLHDGKYCRM